MKLRILIPCILTAGMVAACSGGSGNGTVPQQTQTQQKFVATGTLTLALPKSAPSSVRKPAYVGASTGHAEVFINNTLAGSTTSCTSGACSLSWTYYLSSGSANQSETFAVEADTGSNSPANTILSAGASSYEISPGTNSTPLTLSLSGAAASVTWTAGTLVTGTASGTFAVLDAIGNTITSPGTSFDNAPINFTSTPENVGGGSFSAPTALSSVASDTFTATCTATNGTFQISAIAATASTALDSTTLSILSGQSPAIHYPSASLSAATVYIYNCTSSVITVQGTGSIAAS